ncbi:adenosylcobinamide-phosphate synthase CbiB [Novosphingobium sp. M1R2S20]|uniref:Cobalamin biosynthesis protein CobD n=1 Tax=Novosphingobium rhizovicinum TaxID=3228928 RepID=A0ABV3RE46_9SPHN
MAEPIAVTAFALDAMSGWPARVYRVIGHPVGGFARVISACETRWNRPARPEARRRLLGLVTLGLLIALSGGTALIVERVIYGVAGPWAWLLVAIAAWPALALRSLLDHYAPILSALSRGDLPAARRAVGMIVGRDTDALDEQAVCRAAIESLSESFCDGVIAPLFWLLVLGLPGIWAYKAINTADSMIGHPEEPLRAFGWASARCDDLANWLPARLSGALICLAGGGGWRVLRRDHAKHASPNAGWPEAAMAGALGIRLAGPLHYDGVLTAKPFIGEGGEPDLGTMRKARAVFIRACLLASLSAGGVEWLL